MVDPAGSEMSLRETEHLVKELEAHLNAIEQEQRVKEYDLRVKELALRDNEYQLRRSELEERQYSEWNTFQRDIRRRIDTILRSLLLVSGGALAISIAVFLPVGGPEVDGVELVLLQAAWWLLLGSIFCVLSVMVVIVVSGAVHGRKWGMWLKAKSGAPLRQPRIVHFVGWPLGLASVVFCVLGLVAFALLAVHVVAGASIPFAA